MRAIVILMALAFLAGCQRDAVAPPPVVQAKDDKKPEEKPPEKKPDPPVPMGERATAWAKEIDALMPIEPVDCDQLVKLLPKAPKGYQAREPLPESIDTESSTHGTPPYRIRYNVVEGKYTNGEQTLTVRIVDTAQTADFYKWIPPSAALNEESAAGHQKGLLLHNDPAMEKYWKASQRGELTVMVAMRFQIEITAAGVPPEFLQTVYNSINRKELVALK